MDRAERAVGGQASDRRNAGRLPREDNAASGGASQRAAFRIKRIWYEATVGADATQAPG